MTILYFVLAALALGILVFFHELGHYFMARWVGMKVETFSIGFGKPILKWKVKDVDWQVGWLPFGGYVKIKGMELSKKDKNTYVDPYTIEEGYFSKSPFRRMLVALAGPVANLILAFLIFLAIWAMGGREKPFSDFTQIVGWVDPQSELYAMGVRPGDKITNYDGKSFNSSKDLLYAAMLGDKEVEINGYHIDYRTGIETPFSYKIENYQAPGSLDGVLTTGISSGARYLIYDQFGEDTPNPLTEGSPMKSSGIEYGDRLVWADGELLFSMEQLSHIINDGKAFLTVERNGTVFHTRQPRVHAEDLIVPSHIRNEFSDWQYEAGIKGRWQDLNVLPYNLNAQGKVEGKLTFIDEESRAAAFTDKPYSSDKEQPLEAGDRILAIDGIAIDTAYQLLDLLQTHHVQLIVQKDVPATSKVSWRKEDAVFEQSFNVQDIDSIASTIGTFQPNSEQGDYALLRPVEPKRLKEFALSDETRENIASEIAKKQQAIQEIKDKAKREQAINLLEQSQNRLLLGVVLQDLKVDYNPGPWALFGATFTETWSTLKALVLGYLHPKWVSGPIGIVQVIHHGWTVGLAEALFWIGAISLNLGMLNLLPIPVLDGGYICLSLWEMITGRRLHPKTMERLIIPFVVLLIGLLIFLTFQDISRFF